MNNCDSLTLHQKLSGSIKNLLTLSLDLRQAITHRQTDQIWQILSSQEEQALLFDEYFRLWNELNPVAQNANQRHERQTIQQSLIKLKAVQQANAALTHSFLSAVRRAINTSGTKIATKTNVYNAHGRVGIKSSSVLIKSIG